MPRPLTTPAAPPIPSPAGIGPGPGAAQATGADAGDSPVVDASCHLLGAFSLIVQAIMGVIVLLSLVVKRHREHPRRPWRIWILDVSKQLTGQVYVHVCNVALSAAGAGAHTPHPSPPASSSASLLRRATHLAARATGGPAQSSACSLYFLNIALDTTLGVLIIRAALAGLEWIVVDRLGLDGFQSGIYTPAKHTSPEPHYMQLTHDDTVSDPADQSDDITHPAGAADEARGPKVEALSAPLVLQQPRQPPGRRGSKAHVRSATAEPLLERAFSDEFDSPGPSVRHDEHLPRRGLPDEEDGPGMPAMTGEGLKLSFWARQALLYCLAVTVMKGAVTLLLAILPFLVTLGRAVLSLGNGHPRLQVLFVMALFPTVMNVLQFYMIDSFLRHTPASSEPAASPATHTDHHVRSPPSATQWGSPARGRGGGRGFVRAPLSRDGSVERTPPGDRARSKAADSTVQVTPTSYPPPRSVDAAWSGRGSG